MRDWTSELPNAKPTLFPLGHKDFDASLVISFVYDTKRYASSVGSSVFSHVTLDVQGLPHFRK